MRFSKPKTPGFGISADFYLTVLSSSSVLPPLLAVVNPGGDGGAVPGFGAPLAKSATKESLTEPIGRGAYAIASKDRKTVLEMMVVNKDEAGYDPEAFARSDLAAGANPELMARMRGTWTLAQFRYKSHDPAVFPALQFLLSLCARHATLSEGVVADPISQRYLLPEDVIHPTLGNPPLDPRDLISVKVRSAEVGLATFTLGLQKLALPEMEIIGISELEEENAIRFLYGLTQSILRGNLLQLGAKVGSPSAPFQVAQGGLDRRQWEGIPCYELLPPTRLSAGEALARWRAESAERF